MLAHVPMPSDHHAEGLKDAVRLNEADGSDDRRDADHDIAEQSRHAEQEGGDAPDEAERAFDTLVHDNVVDVVAEIPRHGRGKGVGACREERRSEEHTSELQSLMRISYAVFCLKKKKTPTQK